MSDFSKYFLMKETEVIEYAQVKVPQMDWDPASMTCKEIGDGNLNYVFKVQDGKGHSVIVKQAGVEEMAVDRFYALGGNMIVTPRDIDRYVK